MEPFLSVIVPAYNEAARLSPTLKEISNTLRAETFTYEIIVVNDGSTDDTAKVIETLRPEIKNLLVLSETPNRGKGAAVQRGMLAARGAWRLFMDADGATPFSEFKKMAPYLDHTHAILIGSRTAKGAEILVPQPWHRKVLGRLGNYFIRLLLLPGISDTHCGFKCIRGDAAEQIFTRTRINRWAFDDEALALARAMGYAIQEIPVKWSNTRAHSTFRMSAYCPALRDAIKIKWWFASGKYDL